MALFLGTILNKIDTKGRVSVPAGFRSAIKGGEFEGIVLYHSLTQGCIEGCTMERMEKISEATDSLDLFSEENQNLSSLIFADARQLQFDVTGRIVIPADLIKYAGINGDALFVGKGKTFQIWAPAAFAKAQEAERERALKARPKLMFK
ncbi:MAG: division/cell wall cluster transcriptional repressor MraZ [Rickettsiales bacterium]|jgi:MraZ protein|nr:division/cell wall cluster transcriptional repressor MraZ [Rickettsiales bacterium]